MKYLSFFLAMLLPCVALAQDQPHYIVDVNVFVVTGDAENPPQLTVNAGKWIKAQVDGVSCSVAAFSFGVVAQCNLPTGLDGATAKCNNTIPDNSDSDDSLQVTAHTKLLLKCKTSHDAVK